MAIQARSKGTNKKRARRSAKARSTPTDRRLLAKAEQETAEGSAAVDRIIARLVGPTKKRHAALAAELQAVAGSLNTALGDIIEAHMEEDAQAFGLALRRVNSARVVLEGEAVKLLEARP